MIIIKNRKYHKTLASDIYIGRGSPLGNPYSHLAGTLATFQVDSREQAIESYKLWIEDRIATKNGPVCEALNEIYSRVKSGEKVALSCFCVPQKCHGEIIRDIILAKIKENETLISKAESISNEIIALHYQVDIMLSKSTIPINKPNPS